MSCFKRLDQKLFTWVPASSLESKVSGTMSKLSVWRFLGHFPLAQALLSSLLLRRFLLSKFTQWNLMRIYLCKDLF